MSTPFLPRYGMCVNCGMSIEFNRVGRRWVAMTGSGVEFCPARDGKFHIPARHRLAGRTDKPSLAGDDVPSIDWAKHVKMV